MITHVPYVKSNENISFLVADADCLEQIQRLATRLVNGFRRLLYEERIRRLGLHSLRRRRLRGELIVVYKMFSGGLDLDPSGLA